MLRIPFFTDLDSRAAVKGSRDPLGIQQIWTRLGRHVVGNLTTVSNSVRDFTTLLLGYHFAHQNAQELGPGTELSTFLKWEQLAAYSRAEINGDFAFRGTEKVRKNLADDSRVCLSDDRSHQILGNQKIYGLWGLYTMPARSSGLVDGDPPQLTPPATEVVERLYLPILEEGAGRDAKRIRELLRQKQCRIDVKKGDAGLVAAVAKVLRRKLQTRERECFRFHLLHGGPQDATAGRQQQLADLLDETLNQKDFSWSPATVGQLAKSARSRGEKWEPLAYRLHRIRTGEAVLAPSSALFTYLLGLDGKTINGVASRLSSEWGAGLRSATLDEFRDLHAELGAGDTATGDRWVGIADSLVRGDYKVVVTLLIEQNKNVMAARGGAPWIEPRDGKLHVRFRDEQGSLPKQNELGQMWRFPYFLDSLRSVADTLKEKRDV
jgi:hypothetical protein